MQQNTIDIQTPSFLYHKDKVADKVQSIKNAMLNHWNNYTIAYSVKTNAFPPLAVTLKENGVCAEVVSIDEYNLMKRIGFCDNEIICNGPIKSKSWIYNILNNNTIVNIDSHQEIEHVCSFAQEYSNREVKVGIRVNLELENAFPNETNAGEKGSRFGFSYEAHELERAIYRLKTHNNIRITGLHLHNSTKTRSIQIYKWLTKKFAEIVTTYSLSDISYFDIGGGFFGGLKDKPSWEEYIKSIAEELSLHRFTEEKLKLIIEPGVSLLASLFSYVCSITDIKRTGNQHFAVTDGSRIHVDPLFHKISYYYKLVRKVPTNAQLAEMIEEQQIVGFTCLENDRLFSLINEPLLQIGDVIIIDKVGAYTMTYTPLFISFFPPVYTTTNGIPTDCVRNKWDVEEYIQQTIF